MNAEVKPITHTLLAANRTPIPLEVKYNVHFSVGVKEFSVNAVVTKSVHDFILVFIF